MADRKEDRKRRPRRSGRQRWALLGLSFLGAFCHTRGGRSRARTGAIGQHGGLVGRPGGEWITRTRLDSWFWPPEASFPLRLRGGNREGPMHVPERSGDVGRKNQRANGTAEELNTIADISEYPPGFVQIVIGSAGSGKSTYCKAMRHYLESMGRDVGIVNMDPGNDRLPFECEVDIMDLVSVEEVMGTTKLGPNGALVFAMQYLLKNIDWLFEKVEKLQGKYLLFDFPGQLELYMNEQACKQICHKLEAKFKFKICVVNLVDSHYMHQASNFICATTFSLFTMTFMYLPHVNFISKFDLVKLRERRNDTLRHEYDTYLTLEDLDHLLPDIDEEMGALEGHRRIMEKLVSAIQTYNLVRYHPFSVFSPKLMAKAVMVLDNAMGYIKPERYWAVMGDSDLGKDWNSLDMKQAANMSAKEREEKFGKKKLDRLSVGEKKTLDLLDRNRAMIDSLKKNQ